MDTMGSKAGGAVCATCRDTHQMLLGDRLVMCTRCPAPCQECRQGGNGPYCEKTPCGCSCHAKNHRTTEAVMKQLVAERDALWAESAALQRRFETWRAKVAEFTRQHRERGSAVATDAKENG